MKNTLKKVCGYQNRLYICINKNGKTMTTQEFKTIATNKLNVLSTTDLIAEKAYSTSASGVFDTKLLHQCTLAGGDDYELAFTAPPAQRDAVAAASQASGTPVTRIGTVLAEPGLQLVDAQGQVVENRYASFDHFG